MDAFLAAYQLNFTTFQDLMIQTESLVAGSAALALYLKQEGVDAGFEPNDMDIFTVSDGRAIQTYLCSNGYDEIRKEHSYHEEGYGTVEGIQKVLFFKNKDEKQIQLIITGCGETVFEYISMNFDLTCCVSWWNAAVNQFATIQPEQTIKKEMFYRDYRLGYMYETDSEKLSETHLKRLLKYCDRGFTMIKTIYNPIGLEYTDLRERLHLVKPNKFAGKTAFDTWAYEDVDCCKFLTTSQFNILIYVGNQYYAFHRDNLHNYMKEHFRRVNPIGTVYTMPFNQTVTDHAMCMFIYEDYSIFELVSEYSTQSTDYHPVQVSMFTLKCYTVDQWELGVPGVIIEPPAQAVEDAVADAVAEAVNGERVQNVSGDILWIW